MKKIIPLAFVSFLPLLSDGFAMEMKEDSGRPLKRPKLHVLPQKKLQEQPFESATANVFYFVFEGSQEELIEDRLTEDDFSQFITTEDLEFYSFHYGHLGDLAASEEEEEEKKQDTHPLKTRETTFRKSRKIKRKEEKAAEPTQGKRKVDLYDPPILIYKGQEYPPQTYKYDCILNDPIDMMIPQIQAPAPKKPVLSHSKRNNHYIEIFDEEFKKNFMEESNNNYIEILDKEIKKNFMEGSNNNYIEILDEELKKKSMEGSNDNLKKGNTFKIPTLPHRTTHKKIFSEAQARTK